MCMFSTIHQNWNGGVEREYLLMKAKLSMNEHDHHMDER